MRSIEQTNAFRRDLKREARGRHRTTLEGELLSVIDALACDNPLHVKHRDHALTGNWRDYRDCHIRPDLLLIYRKPDDRTLQLVRLGSHAELGL
ncbi:type II toxin-antitoxin system YafQ family toxin [Aureimonas altamirensis]|uniref:type II toxin-antitoxin system YafQ family toxin n=1 Tax=Aureimonas altamirensis TaxID=370622 RepID=UPI00203681C9|nr:type II toxin-antitoxin system YafQ family toxin [Aureimonas altamirensis]